MDGAVASHERARLRLRRGRTEVHARARRHLRTRAAAITSMIPTSGSRFCRGSPGGATRSSPPPRCSRTRAQCSACRGCWPSCRPDNRAFDPVAHEDRAALPADDHAAGRDEVLRLFSIEVRRRLQRGRGRASVTKLYACACRSSAARSSRDDLLPFRSVEGREERVGADVACTRVRYSVRRGAARDDRSRPHRSRRFHRPSPAASSAASSEGTTMQPSMLSPGWRLTTMLCARATRGRSNRTCAGP